jgi:hypothetical protein
MVEHDGGKRPVAQWPEEHDLQLDRPVAFDEGRGGHRVLEAARNYVSIHSGRNEYLLRETLASLEGKLAQSGFLRTHRSFIVNVERIAEIRAASGGACEIVLESGQHIPLSRGYRDAVRKGLEMTGVRIGRIS